MNENVKLILSKIEKCPHKGNVHDFLSDLFELSAIAISNNFIFSEEREKRYIATINKYDTRTQKLIIEIYAEIAHLLTNADAFGFNDYLGEIYMASATSSNRAGQFFTPYHISRACAELAVSQQFNNFINYHEMMKLKEPSCGAGGFVIATADALNQRGIDYTKYLFASCSDIDKRCVNMAYVQLSLLGIPAIVKHGDSLTNEIWDTYETPAYILQHHNFTI